jgi:hypothetical protein
LRGHGPIARLIDTGQREGDREPDRHCAEREQRRQTKRGRKRDLSLRADRTWEFCARFGRGGQALVSRFRRLRGSADRNVKSAALGLDLGQCRVYPSEMES